MDEYPASYGAGKAIRDTAVNVGTAAVNESARQWGMVTEPAKQFSAGLWGRPAPGAAANIPNAATASANADNPHPYNTNERMAYEATNSPSGRVDANYYKPGNAQIVEANYGQYKDREAARAAQASQPQQYPGAMPSLAFTNARGGDNSGGGDSFAAEQARINSARGGNQGWLALLKSGASQRALDAQRRDMTERGLLGVAQGRLSHDIGRYWQGEHPQMERKLDIEGRQVDVQGRHQQAEERKNAPTIWAQNRINALRQEGRNEEAAQMEREHFGRPDPHAVVQGVGGGTLITGIGTPGQTQQWVSGMPPDWKPK